MGSVDIPPTTMGHTTSKSTKSGLKVPSIILEESVAGRVLGPHLVNGRIPTPIHEGAFLAALEALAAIEPTMRHHSNDFRARSLIKASDRFNDKLHTVYYGGEDDDCNNRDSDSSDSLKQGGEKTQSLASSAELNPSSLPITALASPSPTSPCLLGSTSEAVTRAVEDPKDTEDQDSSNQDASAKIQALESKVARLERTVVILTKLVERSNSARRAVAAAQKQSTSGDSDDFVDISDARQ